MAYVDDYGQSYGGAPTYGTVTASGLEAAMKDMALALSDLLDTQTEVWDIFKKKVEPGKWVGRRMTFPVKKSRTAAWGAVGESAPMPPVGKTDFDESVILPKYLYGTVGLTGQAYFLTQGEGTVEGASDALSMEMDTFLDAFHLYLQSQLWGTGSGIVGSVKAFAAGPPKVVTLQGRNNEVGGSWDSTNTYATVLGQGSTRNLQKGQKVVWGSYATPTFTYAGRGYISKITAEQTFEVTVDADADPTAADIIVTGYYDSTDAVNYTSIGAGAATITYTVATPGTEMMGLLGLAAPYSTAENYVLQQLDPASIPEWAPVIIDAEWNFLDRTLLEQLIEGPHEAAGVNITDIFMNTQMRKHFIDMIEDDRRYSALETKVGWRALEFAAGDRNVKITFHKSVPMYMVYGCDANAIKYSLAKQPGWITWNNGGDILRPVGRRDAAEAFYGMYGNFYTKKRQAIAVMKNVNMTIKHYGA